ncbi:GntR family transcriptional regulator [Croceicoccus mobilis]|uniref:GntR family transcriptional regulator n=1 Tax=Croceicoccus mobilis TaxID=1703339 RepID=A0A916Z747_9SPHN|nr:GntR family transcriptional regulator [Croceicoccus mobilis]GGD79352.1 GntR family transcriptional regulator [Croceicoccus mobilis]
MTSATEKAYHEIKEAILDGRLAPGSQIKEKEVVAMCGVSRTPVRDALRLLTAETFVVRTESQRSFVTEWSDNDLAEMYTMRAMWEGYAAEQAARNITPEIIQALRETNQAIERAVNLPKPDIAAFLEGNATFHNLVIETAASERLTGMLSRLMLAPLMHRTAAKYTQSGLQRSVAEHEDLIVAFENGDPDWAKAIMVAHVRRAYHVQNNNRKG